MTYSICMIMVGLSISFVIINLFSLSGIQAVLNFEDENFYGWEADGYNWSKHPCRRNCKNEEEPMECHYLFVVEKYSTVSKACYNCPTNITDCYRPHCIPADGVQKAIYVANRQLPGPTIEVCKNDIIIVNVRNAMIAESTTIHWHGILQKGSPYMDGVPSVTQCPIQPGTSFRYKFQAVTSGTYLWHSHIGNQRDDGLFGPLIIHSSPQENTHLKLYNKDDKIMFINDWTHLSGDAFFIKDYQTGTQGFADTILINGYGRLRNESDNNNNNSSQSFPYAVFTVKQNKKYRFRTVHAGATDCPVEISIDNHKMLIVSIDANDIKPVEVDSFNIWNGERIDFVIIANQVIENYWIRYRGYGMCARRKIHQVAILRYESAAHTEPNAPIGYDIPGMWANKKILNRHDSGTEDPSSISIPSLNAIASNDQSILRKPDYQFYITYDFYALDNYDFHRKHLYGFYEVPARFTRHSLQLNHITLKMPSFPLLSQNYMIKEDSLCNSTTLANKNCTANECSCTHVLQVKLNSVVELVIIDEGLTLRKFGMFNHPLHLHGHFFRVIAMEKFKDSEQVSIDLIKKLDNQGKIKRKLNHAPIKDTTKVPSNGYTIIRFYANNPGYWLYHCHIDQHTNLGMALIFKVGEHQDLPTPPKHFPKCSNF